MGDKNNYTNCYVFNMFFIHGEDERILEGTVRTFNAKYPYIYLTKSKFRKI